MQVRSLAVALIVVTGCWRDEQAPPVTSPMRPLPTHPAPVVIPMVVADDGDCDEVSCVLDGAQACCEAYRAQHPAAPAAPSGTTTSLDRAMIARGVAAVQAAVRACATQFPAVHGTVKAAVRVAPAGGVTNVDIRETPDAGLGACVASALAGAVFDATTTGGAFAYPFVF